MVQAADFAKTLQLTVLSPSTQTEWDIRTTDLNRPGMQFCGFYEYFHLSVHRSSARSK